MLSEHFASVVFVGSGDVVVVAEAREGVRVECSLVHDVEVRVTSYEVRIGNLRACGSVCIMAGMRWGFLRLILYVFFLVGGILRARGYESGFACVRNGGVVGCACRLVRQIIRRHSTNENNKTDAPDGSHP